MEKASTENSSTGEQGWKMQVRKNRVRNNNAVTGYRGKVSDSDVPDVCAKFR